MTTLPTVFRRSPSWRSPASCWPPAPRNRKPLQGEFSGDHPAPGDRPRQHRCARALGRPHRLGRAAPRTAPASRCCPRAWTPAADPYWGCDEIGGRFIACRTGFYDPGAVREEPRSHLHRSRRRLRKPPHRRLRLPLPARGRRRRVPVAGARARQRDHPSRRRGRGGAGGDSEAVEPRPACRAFIICGALSKRPEAVPNAPGAAGAGGSGTPSGRHRHCSS